MQLQMPGLCVVRHDAQNAQVPSIRVFFKHFLNSVKHTELRGETYDLRLRLVNWLVDEGPSSGSGHRPRSRDSTGINSLRGPLVMARSC
jgi:hypothetical protein